MWRLRGLIWILLVGALFWALRELMRGAPAPRVPKGESEEMVRDPQCGVYLPVTSALRKKVRGETLHFCSKECEEEYSNKTSV